MFNKGKKVHFYSLVPQQYKPEKLGGGFFWGSGGSLAKNSYKPTQDI